MKKNYSKPEVDIMNFDQADIITESETIVIEPTGQGTTKPDIINPSGDF